MVFYVDVLSSLTSQKNKPMPVTGVFFTHKGCKSRACSYSVFNENNLVRIAAFDLKDENIQENEKYEFKIISIKDIQDMDFEEESKQIVKASY